MPISGYIGAGVSEGLEDVLDRRLKEHTRRMIEQQQQEENQLRRRTIDLQQREAEERALDRADDRAYRSGQVARQDASDLAANTDAGPITPEAAAIFRRSPVHAPRVSGRTIIDAKPIAAQSVLPGLTGAAVGGDVTAGVDTSGPQQFDVLAPTKNEARAAKLESDRKTIYGLLARAGSEPERVALAKQAEALGIEVPERYVGPTTQEKENARRLALQEGREFDEQQWLRRNRIEHGQRMALNEQQIRAVNERAKATADAAKPDPKAQAALRDQTLGLAKELREHPGLRNYTGARGVEYGFGAKTDPFAGTQAAGAKSLFDSLQAGLTVDNLKHLKGPLSDKDIMFVKALSTALNRDMPDELFVKKLDELINSLEHPAEGEGWADKGGGKFDPNVKVTIGADDAAEIERRRVLNRGKK